MSQNQLWKIKNFPIKSVIYLTLYSMLYLKKINKKGMSMSNSIIPDGTNTKWLATLLTVIGFAVAAVLWATNAHSELKDWTVERDFVTKEEIVETVGERCAPLSEYIKLRTQLDYLIESSKKIEKRLDNIETKMEKKSK